MGNKGGKPTPTSKNGSKREAAAAAAVATQDAKDASQRLNDARRRRPS